MMDGTQFLDLQWFPAKNNTCVKICMKCSPQKCIPRALTSLACGFCVLASDAARRYASTAPPALDFKTLLVG